MKTCASLIPTALKNPALCSSVIFDNNKRKKKKKNFSDLESPPNSSNCFGYKIGIIFRMLNTLYCLLDNI